ncbi:MAG TPA: sugar ABC transporter substrate-binding protein [Aggregatilinea sp.]|uniref:ABC transporter substrate-binding protein n=1 Tax=Aggregatilinea sp. TaxID=2806333 RepID=UPI002C5A4954|nr:sugar ABC transporter substrate-binding protein [Aggregatilinea sp.]HML21389.1 sugar ABC transporter substrate-binding protein [Aggregatilinea sp.]
MKRIGLMLLIVILAIPVLGNVGAQGDDVVTLTFWDNQQTESGLSAYQQAAVDEFEAAYPNIKIDVVTVPYTEYQDRLILAVQGGNAPDISTVDQIWNPAFAVAGAVMPLDDYIANSETVAEDAFFPGAWQSAMWDNQVWGIPFNVDVWQFSFYNKALFEAAGVDPESITTWDGLKAAAEALTDPDAGQYGVGLFGFPNESIVVVVDSFIFSNGGAVLHEDGSCALDEPESVEALNYLVSLIPYAPEGLLNTKNEDIRQLFLNGSVGIEWWPALEQPTLQSSELDWGFVAGTAPEGKTPVGTYGGWNLVIYDQSQHKEEAWKFIEFLTSKDVNGKVVDLIPANIEAAQSFLAENREGADMILEHLNNAQPRPLSPNYLELSDIEQQMIQSIFSGAAVEDAVADACSQINDLG